MAECKPAASSTTPISSCERIIADFQVQGAPASAQNVQEGSVLGGFEVRTPKVGDGFIEWAIKGYDLDGTVKNPATDPCYDKHGDWMFDKASVTGPVTQEQIFDQNYAKKGK